MSWFLESRSRLIPVRAPAMATVCNGMPSMIGGLGQKILKIRCSEVHFWTLSSEIEHRKVVKKLIF